jgi:hypothetical protein
MYSDPLRDPRDTPLPPTSEEVEEWAAREHKRREAWLAGPSQEEQDDWARRYQRRAALGLAESRLGPSPDDVVQWADREHKRRQSWLAGPTDQEKRDWAGRHRRRAYAGSPESDLPPTPTEVEEWADRERRRRQAWLAGPTEEEQQRWIQRQTGGFWEDDVAGAMGMESELVDSARRLAREVDLATKGSFDTLLRAPLAIWSYLVRSGRSFEDDLYQPPPRRRVRF